MNLIRCLALAAVVLSLILFSQEFSRESCYGQTLESQSKSDDEDVTPVFKQILQRSRLSHPDSDYSGGPSSDPWDSSRKQSAHSSSISSERDRQIGEAERIYYLN